MPRRMDARRKKLVQRPLRIVEGHGDSADPGKLFLGEVLQDRVPSRSLKRGLALRGSFHQLGFMLSLQHDGTHYKPRASP